MELGYNKNEVTKINLDGKKVTGIQLDDQTYMDANNVICYADPPAVYEKIFNGNISKSGA